VKDSGFSDQSDGVHIDPPPEDNVLGHDVVLHLGLEIQVENLELLAACCKTKRQRMTFSSDSDDHKNEKIKSNQIIIIIIIIIINKKNL